MPNIIRRGEPDRERWLRAEFKCYSCGCVWRPEANDAISYSDDQRDGAYLTMRCPTPGCGKSVSTSVPPRLTASDYYDR